LEVAEAIKVAEAAEAAVVNEATKVSKAMKITTDILDLMIQLFFYFILVFQIFFFCRILQYQVEYWHTFCRRLLRPANVTCLKID
jgi:hypothetical protein